MYVQVGNKLFSKEKENAKTVSRLDDSLVHLFTQLLFFIVDSILKFFSHAEADRDHFHLHSMSYYSVSTHL